MRRNRMEACNLRSYEAPQIVQVGRVAAFTAGGGSEVWDPPVEGSYFNPRNVGDEEVDLGAA